MNFNLQLNIEGDGGKRKKAYYEAVELAARVQDFIDYDGPDRTAYAERYALGLGVSLPTLYHYVDNILKANAWALKLEREDGQNREYFRALALCRKPREKATFPSLTDEQRAVIENIWFDRRFAANLGTIEMLYEKFEEIAEGRAWEDYPSIKTVARYVKHLMDSRGAESARYLAANGTREWRNKMMLKGKRDATTLEVMELLVGDEHTFDLWVQYTAPNGKIKAVRPVLVAWMDMRSRAIVGDVICVKANGDTLKESLVKMIYTAGVPKRLLIDNGKDYLLIIDEADKLVSKYTQKKMEILRAIFDQSDVGIVIAGEPKLEAAIKTYLARMANRVDFYISLKGLEPSEVEKYVSEFEVSPEAMVELKARACNMQTGCFRLLDRTLSNVKRILEERGENIVTLKTIEQASSLMML